MKKEVQPEVHGKGIPLFKDEFGHVNTHTNQRINGKEMNEFSSFLPVRHQSPNGHFIENAGGHEKNGAHMI